MSDASRTFQIALVEDNPGDVYLIQEALREKGIAYNLELFQDAEAILSKMKVAADEPRPDLILLDLNLPKIEGLDVLRSLRATPGLDRVPIGILTSSQSPYDQAKAQAAGADRYIQKPTSLDEFLTGVGGAIVELLQTPRA
ncbi:MAG TPA: response regulator [Bryobacteraceae bacterium]|nr:response regulator [Bryobacteraceae bacterium]